MPDLPAALSDSKPQGEGGEEGEEEEEDVDVVTPAEISDLKGRTEALSGLVKLLGDSSRFNRDVAAAKIATEINRDTFARWQNENGIVALTTNTSLPPISTALISSKPPVSPALSSRLTPKAGVESMGSGVGVGVGVGAGVGVQPTFKKKKQAQNMWHNKATMIMSDGYNLEAAIK